MSRRAEVLHAGFGVTESVRWHDGALWFCDLAPGGGVFCAAPGDAAPERVCAVPGRAGGVGWLPDGRLLVVSMEERAIYRREPDGALVPHASLAGVAGGDANDLLVDAAGRAYAGNFGFDYHGAVRGRATAMLYAPPGPPATPLAVFGPDGARVGLTEPLWFPNGMALIEDGRTLVVAETTAMRLTAFAVLDDEGGLGPGRPWAPLIGAALWRALNDGGPRGRVTRRLSAALDRRWIADRSSTPVAPDGLCAHTDDATVWVANALRGECLRIGEGGAVLDRVRTSAPALSCALGGPERSTLYIATTSVIDPQDAAVARTGRIEAVDLG